MTKKNQEQWEQAQQLNECMRAFITANFPNTTYLETSVAARPSDAFENSFDVRIRTSLGQEQGNRMAVLKALDTAAEYYAREINPKATIALT